MQTISLYVISSVIIQNVRLRHDTAPVMCVPSCLWLGRLELLSNPSPSPLELPLYREYYYSFGECFFSCILHSTRSEKELVWSCSPLSLQTIIPSLFKTLCFFRLFPLISFMIHFSIWLLVVFSTPGHDFKVHLDEDKTASKDIFSTLLQPPISIIILCDHP